MVGRRRAGLRIRAAGLLLRIVRVGLPLALLTATAIAVLGLAGVLIEAPVSARPTPAVALDLSSAPALPEKAVELTTLPVSRTCPAPLPTCAPAPPAADPAGLPGCCP